MLESVKGDGSPNFPVTSWVAGRSANQVPLLLQDPITRMLHFILSLPVNIEKAYFDTIIHTCYNLHMVQIFLRLTSGVSVTERLKLKQSYFENPSGNSLACNLGHIVSVMERSFKETYCRA